MTTIMETQAQQPQLGNSTSPPDILSVSGGNNSNLLPISVGKESESQWQQVSRQIPDFLNKLPDFLGSAFHKNKPSLIMLVLILSAFVAVKVAIALLDAVNSLPVLQPILELIGLFYSIWFTFRYLLKCETRQELSQKFNAFKQQSLG
ncbi:CAAD domain-containing protein [Cuspidothrix issatschenkoi LEGE 03284]|nr:CAAD domain-containing protein [Cuspidothrix issatschenkoi LEGE 03284]